MNTSEKLSADPQPGRVHLTPGLAVKQGDCVATAPDMPLKYRPDVDGLRAIAVLSVVMFHAAPGRMPGGFVGVDIFFVISGFLISTIILHDLQMGRFTFENFYSRRIRRIFPPLLIVMGTALFAGALFFTQEDYRALGKHIAAGSAFVSNFAMWSESGYFDTNADFKLLLHLWSLGVEEQFYIVWPILLYALHAKRARTITAVCLVGGLSFIASVIQTETNPVAAFYSPVTRFWELLVGCATALFLGAGRSRQRSNIASAAGLALLFVAFALIDRQSAFPGMWALLPTAGAALLIWAGPEAWCNRYVLANKVLVAAGLISYSLYLWHWPLLAFLRISAGTEVSQSLRAGAVLVAVILSALSYRFVERPIRARGRGRAAPLVLAALMILLAFLGLGVYRTDAAYWRPLQPSVVNAGDIGHEHFFGVVRDNSYPCLPVEIRRISDTWNGMTRCFQSRPQDAQDIAIIGDSHGEHLFPGLAGEFKQSNVVFYGMDGLPLLSNKDFAPVFSYVERTPTITTVFLAAAWGRKLRNADPAKWRAEMQETVGALVAKGKKVYLVEDVHAFSFAPNICKYDGRLWIQSRCSEPAYAAAYLPAFRAIADANPRVRVVSPNAAFCASGQCDMARNGTLLYRDEHHLGIAGSKLAASELARQVDPMSQPSNGR